MTQSARKLLGTVLTLIVLVLYVWAATGLYAMLLTGAPALVLLAYFAIAGLLWAVPISFIIRWMARPDKP
jgi:predicted exporter